MTHPTEREADDEPAPLRNLLDLDPMETKPKALADQARDVAARAINGSSEIVSLAYAVTVLADALDVAAALIGNSGANEANAFPLDIVRRLETLERHIKRLDEAEQKLSDRIANRAKMAAHILDRVGGIEARLDGLDGLEA